MKEIFQNQITQASKKILTYNWGSEEFFCNWTAQTYYYVCHSTRLLALAASRFDKSKDALHQRFLKHCQEEKRHEELATHDLRQFAKSLEEYPELFSTQNFYQTQYYWIDQVAPETFFGYILALEALAVEVGGKLSTLVSKNFPNKKSSFLELHSQEDPHHVTQAYELIEKLSHDSFLKQNIIRNFEQALDNYQAILNECLWRSSQNRSIPLKKIA